MKVKEFWDLKGKEAWKRRSFDEDNDSVGLWLNEDKSDLVVVGLLHNVGEPAVVCDIITDNDGVVSNWKDRMEGLSISLKDESMLMWLVFFAFHTDDDVEDILPLELYRNHERSDSERETWSAINNWIGKDVQVTVEGGISAAFIGKLEFINTVHTPWWSVGDPGKNGINFPLESIYHCDAADTFTIPCICINVDVEGVQQ